MTQLIGATGVVDGLGTSAITCKTPLNFLPTCSSLLAAASFPSHPNWPEHDAKDNAESMSRPGSLESVSQHSQQPPQAISSAHDASRYHAPLSNPTPDWQRRKLRPGRSQEPVHALENLNIPFDEPNRELPFAHMRVHFEEFASQLRLRRHHEHRKRILSGRKRYLQKAVALSARLHRVGSWVHVGLVQISTQGDTAAFARVHKHMQDLIDLCLSQWSHEIQTLDVPISPKPADNESFLSQLQPDSRAECLDLIQTLRANPRFLVEKFKAMSAAQISALSTFPRFSKLPDSVLSSLRQNRGRFSQRTRTERIESYSKELEEYASSFERSNPLSFLLHNVYGASNDIGSYEGQLRISTWSSICANLMMEASAAYDEIISHVLFAFASLYQWRIKDRLELFLMKILQEGAFLLDRPETSASTSQFEFVPTVDAFGTPQAQEFFNEAVKDLLQLLACSDGIPPGALHLGHAIMAKLPSEEDQLRFRGDFIFKWFMRDFLRDALDFPEVRLFPASCNPFPADRQKRTRECFSSFISATRNEVCSCITSTTVPPPVHAMSIVQCKPMHPS